MKTPAFLSALTLLFWAWQTGNWIPGIACAIAVESHYLLQTRWQLSVVDIRQAARAVCLLMVALFSVFTISRGLPYSVIPTIIWLPITVLPLLLVQIYTDQQSIDVEALFILKRESNTTPSSERRINVHWPFFVIALLATSAGNVRDSSFYIGMCSLIAWALWHVRPVKAPVWLWFIMLCLAGSGGYAGASGLVRLQVLLIDYSGDFLGGGNVDPYRTSTDIGELGTLKQTNRIMLRIIGPDKDSGSFLLHRASYDSYGSPTWFARKSAMTATTSLASGGQWQLNNTDATHVIDELSTMRIIDEFPRGSGVLSLPAGATTITSNDFDTLKQNRLGVVKATGRAGDVSYSIAYQANKIHQSPPTDQDLKTPLRDTDTLKRLAKQLQLNADNNQAAQQSVKRFFDSEFKYALFQPERNFKTSPLVDFLVHNRFGHCEYFATATVMLLRAAGIPTRYATGYSVQEYSRLEQAWRVRQRHAHAWARVWTGSGWVDLDTTPKAWLDVENAQASIWEPLVDLVSWLRFQFAKWRQTLAKGDLSPLWLSPLMVIVLWVAWKVRKRGTKKPVLDADYITPINVVPWPGQDSGYYRIERRLAEIGLLRQANETPQDWSLRILSTHPDLKNLPSLDSIIKAHYYYRFNPSDLSADQSRTLTDDVTDWLTRFERYFEEHSEGSLQKNY